VARQANSIEHAKGLGWAWLCFLGSLAGLNVLGRPKILTSGWEKLVGGSWGAVQPNKMWLAVANFDILLRR
jgi:hypothetical protein